MDELGPQLFSAGLNFEIGVVVLPVEFQSQIRENRKSMSRTAPMLGLGLKIIENPEIFRFCWLLQRTLTPSSENIFWIGKKF